MFYVYEVVRAGSAYVATFRKEVEEMEFFYAPPVAFLFSFCYYIIEEVEEME